MEQVEHIVKKLNDIYTVNEAFPNCTFIYGQKSVGKSLCIKSFQESITEDIKSAVIHADECYHNKILFESIVNAFNDHELSDENNYEPFAKIDSMEEFLNQISTLEINKSYLIIIKRAEKLIDMDLNIIPTLMKLQEFTGLNISSILISHIILDKFGVNGRDFITLHIPDYSKNDVIDILMNNYSSIHNNIIRKIEKSQLSQCEKERKLEAAASMDEDFYKNFLNIFLNVFFKACRDLKELSSVSEKCFVQYYTPVLSGEINHNDVTNLWRNITKYLRMSLNSIHMRVENIPINTEATERMEMNENDETININRPSTSKTFAQMLELPYYAKYLLIASFLASHNDSKSDKKLFMKHHGKERKKNQKIMSKVS